MSLDVDSLEKKSIHRDRYMKYVFNLFITKDMLRFRMEMLAGWDESRLARLHELHREEVDLLILKTLRSLDGDLGKFIINGAAPLVKALAIDRFVETIGIMDRNDLKKRPRWSLKSPHVAASYALLLLAPFHIEHLPYSDEEENKE